MARKDGEGGRGNNWLGSGGGVFDFSSLSLLWRRVNEARRFHRVPGVGIAECAACASRTDAELLPQASLSRRGQRYPTSFEDFWTTAFIANPE